MKSLLFVIFAVSMLFPVYAHSKDGWSIQLEPMLMGVKGMDEHVGDIFH